ncbi:c-type cytochrome [Pseudodonghicola xiamenensis]|uniref:Alcohol dehydrogenase n=1 Tax=Pseudodonghicola xiamenensis TaxID=337702 RepID=A0A8J3HB92_9RHOB|nr:cytochrome c [Pseudodonghicola xiamenensis]GHH03457.1 alcohol dehydrogenase [Pseudodonghicola xiamenensis]
MKLLRLVAVLAVLCVIAAGGLLAWGWLAPTGPEPEPPFAGLPADMPAGMSRGEYLAKAADCVACHTAKGGEPYAGGLPFHLPFGTIYATNLTPDDETGIGALSADDFVRAVREGVGSQGHLYPAMPYTSYAKLSRDDVLVIRDFLMTLTPVHAVTPKSDLDFPFDQRWGMAFWNAAFFREERFRPDPGASQQVNRGEYLATALGHCGECHTPRNIGFAMQSRDYLAGTEVEGWKAYNTTSDTTYGVGGWTDAQLKGYLWRGHAPGRSSAAGPMAEVVEYSLQNLSESDIDALVAYMRKVEPATGEDNVAVNIDPAAVAASTPLRSGGDNPAYLRGERLFQGDCAGCHQYNGVGRQTDFAALSGSRAVNDPSGTALVQVLLNGTEITVQGRHQFMPGFARSYSNADVAAVANYVLSHFGDTEGKVDAGQVETARSGQAALR